MQRIRLALLAGLLTAAAIPVAIAMAAAPAAPTVTASAASGVSSAGATLHGSVNPNGLRTDYAFQYGTSTSYGEQTSPASAGSGTSPVSETASIAGLQPGTVYHFRLLAINSQGTSVSSPDQTFTTTGKSSPSTPPAAVTGQASGVGGTSATLSGSVNANGQATSYHFEYGPTADYGFETASASAGSGSTPVNETAGLSGLAPNTTYHYAIVAVSPGGVVVGPDATFTTTDPPAVTSAGPSNQSSQSVTLNGTVDPNGHATSYYFQYGTSGTYGLQTAPASAGSGTSTVAVHSTVTGLTPKTTYHYRLVATSDQGTSYGADETAQTTGPAVPVSRIKLMGHMGFVSPGNVIGVEIGCFDGQTACAGTFTFSVNGNTIGSGSFKMNSESGGFHNFKLNSRGVWDLRGNHANHLLVAKVLARTTSGQTLNGRLSLARWFWHD